MYIPDLDPVETPRRNQEDLQRYQQREALRNGLKRMLLQLGKRHTRDTNGKNTQSIARPTPTSSSAEILPDNY
ncbi:unnamed protein product, partial [Amoebophrya sp. A25]|eukprot:GSA25T00003679001.1